MRVHFGSSSSAQMSYRQVEFRTIKTMPYASPLPQEQGNLIKRAISINSFLIIARKADIIITQVEKYCKKTEKITQI